MMMKLIELVGVGEKTVKLFEKLGIYSDIDLIFYFHLHNIFFDVMKIMLNYIQYNFP